MYNEADELLTAAEAAKEMGVDYCTVRWYDREGLLQVAVVTRSGRRLYRLGAIRDLKALRGARLPRRSKQVEAA